MGFLQQNIGGRLMNLGKILEQKQKHIYCDKSVLSSEQIYSISVLKASLNVLISRPCFLDIFNSGQTVDVLR